MQHSYFDDEWDPTAPVFYSDEADEVEDVGVPAAPVWTDGDRREEMELRAELAAARSALTGLSDSAYLAETMAAVQRVQETSARLSAVVSPPAFAGADGGFGAGGAPGGGGVVRVWFGPDHQLTKVRISPVWYTKLRPGQTLAQLFTFAFRRYALSLAAAPLPAERPRPAGFDRPVPGVSLDHLLMALDRQEALYDSVVNQAVEGAVPAARTVGRFAGAEVELSEAGLLDLAWFDEGWLNRTQVGKVRDAVVAAAADAFSRYAPASRASEAAVAAAREQHEVLLAGLKSFIGY
ncbi:hypothetical protein [Tessaracoccus sp. OH4464_COT-324]|uniref:hypothetical protein n=1 Tax=Tessaracoccus sp. OH4464_COT-324 TaxID=2491059 RepID=UPI000F6307ED|nr:hypothetical protein [Tessaracoccus sp. OH4464_COT-324]RRD46896.1 hypothetical protein EII42_05560 [Tessaracoccus sp. OH4464_COT-324]